MKSHILIIDDDISYLEMVRLILEEYGPYRVTTIESAMENVMEIKHLRPHLILLDLFINRNWSGWTFLQKIKLYRPTKDIPLVVCTSARPETKEQEAVLAEKGIPILYKPFNIDDLLHIVEQTLASSHPGAQSRERSSAYEMNC